VVIPFLNEEDCIADLCRHVENVARDNPFDLELILVDDGSTDKTVGVISAFPFEHCKTVRVVSLSKNFGSHAAIRAGIKQASGDYCTFIGADLQEPDDILSVMYSGFTEGFDAVYIEKSSIAVSMASRAFSLIYSALMRKYAVRNYGSGGVNSIAFSRKIIDYLNKNVELNSSINLQILNAGFANKTIKMDYKERAAGKSKWTFGKKIKLLIDSFVSFSFMPIRAVSIIGIIMAVFGFVFGAYIVLNRILHPEIPVPGYPSLAALLLFGFGITNISLGIIAEYLWRTYDAARNRPAFIISDINEIK